MTAHHGMERVVSLIRSAVVLTVLTGICACSTTTPEPSLVLRPIDINQRAFVPTARVSWHEKPAESQRAVSFTGGVELQYSRGRAEATQSLGALDFISYGGQSIFGPQVVRHFAELRYGHLVYDATIRFRRLPRLELEVVAGVAEADLRLRSETEPPGGGELARKYAFSGIVVGVGPRWNFTRELAVEGRLMLASNRPFALFSGGGGYHDYVRYPEIAFRFRPAENVALRAGLSRVEYEPTEPGGDSSIYVVMRGPFLG
ncbi:MAG: hypothetical protein WBO23_17470, partial [Burkholderiales bacterium]